jgi:hypothetical protein
MDWIQNHADSIILFGLVIIAASMLRQTIQRFQKNAEKTREREVAVKAAQEAERKQRSAVVLPQSKGSSSKTRTPMGDALGTPFTGNVRGIAAKWEAEVHQIGRHIIGQIDCKMAALQAMTLNANRTANRLEMLVEHLEQIARQQIEWQQQQTDESPTVIPTAELMSEAVPLAGMLKELTDDLQGIRNTIRQSTSFSEQPGPTTILRLPDSQEITPANRVAENLRGEVEMLANYGLAPEEIARRLNISLGEVDLVLQVQQSQWGLGDAYLDSVSP